ncbi:MAG: TIGR04283 family arsenosugar biosynthesis glycosyltransferase [Elusimicrobia bacterium]|nr:TIGR04283 family arsenosugar biosynthesis glycosyltransferase [Elusimicrobiota bacterium]
MNTFSVILPVWNEEARIQDCLLRIREQSPESEIVVVDGGSSDRTAERAANLAHRIVKLSYPNRGVQLHRGAEASSGEFLLFLHVDCVLPRGWPHILKKNWSDSKELAATVFSIDYGQPKFRYHLIEKVQHLRCRWFQVVYGDHAFCVSREMYDRSGGFPAVPLMEDLAFCHRLRSLGKIKLLPEKVQVSPRRQMKKGPLRNALWNNVLLIQYYLGISPEKLWQLYYNAKL